MALFIREEEVQALLTMEEALSAVEEAFRLAGEGRADNRPRQRPRLDHSMLQAMPGAVYGVGLGLKAYSVTSKGARFAVLLWDDETGDLLALIEAAELGRIRTGAASGVATKYLARNDSSTVGVFGSGFQAGRQLEAVCAVRDIREAYVYSPNELHRAAFAERTGSELGIPVHPAQRPADASHCDIVVTITNAREPVFAASDLREGSHINAAGSNRRDAAEIDPRIVGMARIFIDDRIQGEAEAGDLLRAGEEGAFSWDRVEEIGDLVADKITGRRSREEITLYESLGIAIEDIAAARRVYELAIVSGAGERLPKSLLG